MTFDDAVAALDALVGMEVHADIDGEDEQALSLASLRGILQSRATDQAIEQLLPPNWSMPWERSLSRSRSVTTGATRCLCGRAGSCGPRLTHSSDS